MNTNEVNNEAKENVAISKSGAETFLYIVAVLSGIISFGTAAALCKAILWKADGFIHGLIVLGFTVVGTGFWVGLTKIVRLLTEIRDELKNK